MRGVGVSVCECTCGGEGVCASGWEYTCVCEGDV